MKLLATLLLSLAGALAIAAETDIEDGAAKIRQVEMQQASVNGIEIGYKVLGNENDPAVVLIMGLGASHLLWGDDLSYRLVDAGYRVVLFDNRDVGASYHFDAYGDPVIWWQFLKMQFGFDVDAPYELGDMANDTVALMDELGLDQAHIVGASMGGMIAQVIAARYPERTQTLTSIMSTPGFSDDLPQSEDQAGDQLMDLASGESEEETMARLNHMGFHPQSMPRQLMAIVKAGDRSEEVAKISVPTLVVHGIDDTLIPPRHGEYTSELIKGSKYIVFEGMGHNLPADVLPDLVVNMVDLMRGPAAAMAAGAN